MLEGIINSKSKTLAAWGQSPSTRFLFYCFCFLVGVLAISIVDKKIPFVYLYVLLFIILSFIIYFWRDKKIRRLLFCCFIFTLGTARYLLAFPANEIKEGQAEFIGYVASEPDVRIDGVKYIVETSERASVQDKIYVKSGLYPRYQYGDVLRLKCKLQKPEASADFRYDMYLARQGVFAVCLDPQLEKIGEGEGNLLFQGIYWLKNKVAEKVESLWQEPYASFIAGLLYGYRGGLGELNDAFSRTGITHIVAISGYNISIISLVLLTGLVYLYVPRKKAFWLVISVIALFVIFTGANPSVVRAGIMGVLVLTAKQLGRLSRMANVLTFTATLMVLVNPFVLAWDAGFQLSFAATLGLVYLSPYISVYFKKVPEIFGLRESVVSTSAAIIATLPLILFQFGRLSIVAPVVNVLILWLIPFLMLFGFLAVIVSFIFYPLAQVIAWIVFVGLKYIVVVVQWFAGLKFSAIDLRIPWWGMIGVYFFLVYLILRIKNTNKI